MSLSSIPRPVLFALIGVVLVGGVFVVTRKKSNESSSTGNTPTTTTPTKTTPAPTQAPPSSKPDTSKSTTKPGTTTTTPSQSATTKVELTKLPAPVAKALRRHDVVAILFWRKQGVEDRMMQRTAANLRHDERAKTAVFDPGIGALTRWLRITGAEGLSQTPSYIVIDRNGKADVQTGFVDGDTMENAILNDLHNMHRSGAAYKNYGT